MNRFRRRGRVSNNQFTTRSGNTIKIHRSLSDRVRNRKELKSLHKAERLAGMPKSRLGRFFYRLRPSHLYHYWFSREGGVMALKILGIGLITGFLLLVGMFAYFRKDLPNLRGDITGSNIGGSIRYYDRSGKTLLWEDYDAVKRIPVKDAEINDNVKNATIAIEDKDFFKHGGFDVRGIMRAGVNNTFGSGGTQGGSTITQQLVKLSQNWTKERTITRKLKEVILAVELERNYSKQEILVGYLNTAPYGNVQYGVESATRDYFDKSAKKLTLDEAAFLAAIPKAPSTFSPYGPYFDKEALTGRQHYVLDLMTEQGMITPEQRDKAKKVNTLKKVKKRKPKYDGIKAPWFVLTAKSELEAKYGSETVKRGGWKVITTLDSQKQEIAEQEVANGIHQVRAQGGDVAAFAAEDVKTGQMVALVGGTDFRNKQFGENNYARLRLPPGSSFKPYDYTALIEHTNNTGAGSVLYDTQGPLEGYPCTNKSRPQSGGNCLYDYDFRYPGPVTVRYALGASRNVPAVKAMLTVGIDKTIQTAEKLGLKSGYKCYADDTLTKESQCHGSSAIGDGAYLRLDEHVHGFSSISRNGRNIPQTYILKIEDAGGKTVHEWKAEKGEQAVREESAYIISDILSDPRASYMTTKLHNFNGHKFSAKTGTTNDSKDGWMMGFSTQYAAGVWVGHHSRGVEMSGFMETMTRPIWQNWMNRVHTGLKPEERKKPGGIKTAPAYVIRSHVGGGTSEPSPSTDIFPGWYNNNKKRSNEKRTIDIVSNKLATSCTPSRAKKVVSELAADSFSADQFTGTGGSATSQKDDVHKCSDRKPNVSLTAKKNGDGSYDLVATVSQGTHPLSGDKFKGKLTLSAGGQLPGGSYDVNSPGSFSYKNYKPSSSTTVTASIVDSVLYDDSASVSIKGSNTSNLTVTAKKQGGSVKIEWSNGSGSTAIYNEDGDNICNGGSSGSCTVSLATAPQGSVVTATSGSKTKTTTVSGG